jgi:hypothetical protein
MKIWSDIESYLPCYGFRATWLWPTEDLSHIEQLSKEGSSIAIEDNFD